MSDFNSHSTPNSAPTVTCFHDGDCPICAIEVTMMKKLDHKKSITWVDITKDKAALHHAGLSYDQAMAKMYVIDHNGDTLYSGVEGFLQVWKQLPYYRRLVPIVVHVPLVLPLLKALYAVFARYRLTITGKKPRTEE